MFPHKCRSTKHRDFSNEVFDSINSPIDGCDDDDDAEDVYDGYDGKIKMIIVVMMITTKKMIVTTMVAIFVIYFLWLIIHLSSYRVGLSDANVTQDIQLSGSYINEEHCIFENKDSQVTLKPFDGRMCYINGSKITEPTQIFSGKSWFSLEFFLFMHRW